MELLIIFVVISFLIGTIGFALPSKSSKKISELRLNASRLGLKIVPSNIGKNSFKNKDVNLMIYSQYIEYFNHYFIIYWNLNKINFLL